MNIGQHYKQILIVVSIFFSGCTIDPESIPAYIFSDNFDNSNQWSLRADTIFFNPIFTPSYRVQEAKIENGLLYLSSRQSSQCASAVAKHSINLSNLDLTSSPLVISLKIQSLFRSTSGYVNLIVIRDGVRYTRSIGSNIEEPKMVKFTFDGEVLKRDDESPNYFYSYTSQTSQADGIFIEAEGCGADNFHFANVSIDAIYVYSP
jgi:hypothetical protein